MATVRLTVTTAEGNVLDSIEVEREEFVDAQHSGMDALSLLEGLSIGEAGD